MIDWATPKDYSGIWTALITPMDSQGRLDFQSFEHLVKRQIKAEVRGIAVCGTTGEAPTLTVQEKLSIIRKAKAMLPPHIELMAGTGSSCTQSTIELSKLSLEAGADSLLISTPPYNKPSFKGLENHYTAISQATRAPICLYHVPGRTGQMLSAEQIQALCDIPQIVAVKEASGNMELFSKIASHAKAQVLSGDDLSYLPSLSCGGVGCISVISNYLPEKLIELTNLFTQGKMASATTLHQKLLPAMEALFVESNPGPIKGLLSRKNIGCNFLRPPLYATDDNLLNKIEKIFQDL